MMEINPSDSVGRHKRKNLSVSFAFPDILPTRQTFDGFARPFALRLMLQTKNLKKELRDNRLCQTAGRCRARQEKEDKKKSFPFSCSLARRVRWALLLLFSQLIKGERRACGAKEKDESCQRRVFPDSMAATHGVYTHTRGVRQRKKRTQQQPQIFPFFFPIRLSRGE